MKQVIVSSGQCLMDIALQEYGSATAVEFLLQDNPELQYIDEVPVPGTVLHIRETPVIDENNVTIAAKLAADAKRVNTGNLTSTTGYVDEDYVQSEYVI